MWLLGRRTERVLPVPCASFETRLGSIAIDIFVLRQKMKSAIVHLRVTSETPGTASADQGLMWRAQSYKKQLPDPGVNLDSAASTSLTGEVKNIQLAACVSAMEG